MSLSICLYIALIHVVLDIEKQLCHIRPLDLEKISETFWEATFEIVIQSLFKKPLASCFKHMQRLETWSYVIRDQSAGRKEIRTTESNGHWFHRWGFNDDTLALCFSGSKVTDDNAGESHTEEAFQWLLNEAPLPVLDIFPRLIRCHGLFLWCFEVIKWSFIEICSNFYQNPRIWSGDTSWRRQDQGTLADSQNRVYAPCSCRSWMVSGTSSRYVNDSCFGILVFYSLDWCRVLCRNDTKHLEVFIIAY